MNSEYTTAEIAKLAKQKGLSIGSSTSYTEYLHDYIYDMDVNHPESHREGDIRIDNHFYTKNNSEVDLSNKHFIAYERHPREVVQKWLMKTHKIFMLVHLDTTMEPKFCYNIYKYNDEHIEWALVSKQVIFGFIL